MKQTEKQKEWKQNEYQLNKEVHRLRQQKRRKAIRELIESQKKPCIVCDENETCCIDFHHRDSTEKEFEIADVCARKWSDTKILNELAKCVTLCSNHHRILHKYDLTVDELISKYKK